MAITEIISNSSPRNDQGIASALIVATAVVPPVPATNDFCYCGVECSYQEFAFADLSDSADYKNDTSSFLFDRAASSSTSDFELWKDGSKLVDITDSTLGTYYDGFTAQPLYKGVILDWRLVATAYGFGTYQFRAQQNILGNSYTYESRVFKLVPYSDELADGTVRVKGYQQGNIVSGLDYTGLVSGGWPSAYRIEGSFGDKQYTLEKDLYENARYEQKQIRDEVIPEYTLETNILPAEVGNWLAEDASLSNFLLMSDYNLFNTEVFRDIKVSVTSFEEVSNSRNIRRSRYVIKMQRYRKDLIKRNF